MNGKDVISKFNWSGDEAVKFVDDQAMAAALLFGEKVLAASKKVIPHEHGELQRSGTVIPDLAAREVIVSYNTPYARRQHEDLTLSHPAKDTKNHPRSKAGRQAKYLEEPFAELAPQADQFIELKVKTALKNKD